MRNVVMIFALTGAIVFGAALPVLAQATDPVAVLKSDAAFLDKLEACRVLQLKGGREAVPALAAMLSDEKLSHPARLALEAMPCAEAGKALRDALGTTNGLLKVGVIGSLAIRKDTATVPVLIGLLADTDAAVAQASAAALGKLATAEAIRALQKAVAQPNLDPVTLLVLCNSLLDAAEALATDGKQGQAAAVYEYVLEIKNTPSQVPAAALRGAALAKGGNAGDALLVKALGGDDQAAFDAALRALRELDKKDAVAKALAEALPPLADDRKIAVIQVLGEGGGQAAGPALLAEAQKGAVEVQVAALRAMVRIGFVPALDLVKDWLNSPTAELSKAAQDALSFFPGKEGDDMLKAMLQSSKADERRMAVELIGKGGLNAPADVLLGVAKNDSDEGVRVGALQALRNHAGMDEVATLLNNLMTARSQAEMDAAESVLAAICGRQQKAAPGELAVQEAVYGSLPDGPSANVTDRVTQILSGGAFSVAASNTLFGDTAPGLVKKLRVNYTVKGVPATQTVQEGETLVLNTASVPPILTESLTAMLQQAPADRKLAFLRLLGTTGSSQALETVKGLAFQGEDGPVKDLALREVCNWSTVEALPTVLDLALNAKNPDVKVLALRGAVRLLGQPQVAAGERLKQYAVLMDKADTADDRKLVLSGLAQVRQTDALEMVLRQFGDEAVKAEAVQAAIAIAKGLGKSAKEDNSLYDGKDISGWQGNKEYWRFDNGVIIGGGDKPVAKNEFLWAPGTVGDFYLAVDVKLEPNTGNGGIQFRSKKVDEHGQALGYQADVGQGYWGKLYHEHGRGQLDGSDHAEAEVKPGDWNHYEILAVGPAIWLAINGKLGAACLDLKDGAERTGAIAVQIHSGPPQTIQYKVVKLVHNPEIKLAGFDAKRLFTELKAAEQK